MIEYVFNLYKYSKLFILVLLKNLLDFLVPKKSSSPLKIHVLFELQFHNCSFFFFLNGFAVIICYSIFHSFFTTLNRCSTRVSRLHGLIGPKQTSYPWFYWWVACCQSIIQIIILCIYAQPKSKRKSSRFNLYHYLLLVWIFNYEGNEIKQNED